jgi:hypothetical protein
MAGTKEAILMTSKLTTGLIAVSVAAFLALAGAVSTAEAGRGGGHGGGGKYKGSGKHYVHGGNWSGKYGHHHHKGKFSHYRRYGYPWYGLPLYSYGGRCGWLYNRAVATGNDYWWSRYYQCTASYY